ALGQGLEAVTLNRREMDENVLAAFLGNETKALRLVEPLHRTTSHLKLLLTGDMPQHKAARRGDARPPWPGSINVLPPPQQNTARDVPGGCARRRTSNDRRRVGTMPNPVMDVKPTAGPRRWEARSPSRSPRPARSVG